jgi:hypothetical protein
VVVEVVEDEPQPTTTKTNEKTSKSGTSRFMFMGKLLA